MEPPPEEQGEGQKKWRKRVCTCLSIAVGLQFFVLGIAFTVLYFHFTPLYTDIECFLDPVQFKRVSFRGGLTIKLNVSTTCWNPNPYTVEIKSNATEQVFVGRQRVPAATVLEMPHALLPADSWGSINGLISIKPTRQVFPSLFSLIMAGDVPIYLENKKQLTLNLDLILTKYTMVMEFSQRCGVKVRLTGLIKAKVGSPACGKEFGDLELPAVRIEPKHGSAPAFPKNKGERMMAKVEGSKTLFFALAMAVTYALGILFTCFKCSFVQWCCFTWWFDFCCCSCWCIRGGTAPRAKDPDDFDNVCDPDANRLEKAEVRET